MGNRRRWGEQGPPAHMAMRTELPELLLLMSESNRERKGAHCEEHFLSTGLVG